jgi:hypothetical protein
MKSSLLFLALALSLSSAHAATVAVTQGQMNIDYDAFTLGFLGLSGPNHFTQVTSNSLTAAQVENAGASGNVLSYTGLEFAVNTGAPASPSGRFIQNSTLTYDVSDLTGTLSGQVGLGGVTRFAFGSGGFIMGDFSLEYNAARATGAQSGWYLENHYSFPLITFDLGNVTTTITGNDFALSGDILASPEFNGAFGVGNGTDFGNFSFTTAPEPSRALLGFAGLTGVLIRRRRKAA